MKKTILGVVLSGLLFSGAAHAQLWPFSSSSDSKEGEGVGSSESITNSESMTTGKRSVNSKTVNVHNEILKSLGQSIPAFYTALSEYDQNMLYGFGCMIAINDPNHPVYRQNKIKSYKDIQRVFAKEPSEKPGFNQFYGANDVKFYRYMCSIRLLKETLNETYTGWPSLEFFSSFLPGDSNLGKDNQSTELISRMKTTVLAIPYFEQVAEQAQNKSFRTEADFRQFADNMAWEYFGDDANFSQFIEYALDLAFEKPVGSFRVDLSGKNPAPIHFIWTSPDKTVYDFEGSSGIVIKNGGTVLLGDGMINGKKYEINASNERGMVVNRSRVAESVSNVSSGSSNAAAAGTQ